MKYSKKTSQTPDRRVEGLGRRRGPHHPKLRPLSVPRAHQIQATIRHGSLRSKRRASRMSEGGDCKPGAEALKQARQGGISDFQRCQE